MVVADPVVGYSDILGVYANFGAEIEGILISALTLHGYTIKTSANYSQQLN